MSRVKFTEAKAYYVAALRRNPNTPAPKVRMTSVADFHEWKAEMRAYDAARLDLNLATPQQIQTHNAAIRVREGARIVRHAEVCLKLRARRRISRKYYPEMNLREGRDEDCGQIG